MRRLLAILLLVPLGVLLVALAVVNRKPVTLGLNPLDASSGLGIEAPFFLFLLGAFAIGLIVGGIVTWSEQGKWRAKARSQVREVKALRAQADRLEKELEGAQSRPIQARLPAD